MGGAAVEEVEDENAEEEDAWFSRRGLGSKGKR